MCHRVTLQVCDWDISCQAAAAPTVVFSLLGAGAGQVDGLGVARPAIAPASDSPAHTPIAGPNPAVNVAGEE